MKYEDSFPLQCQQTVTWSKGGLLGVEWSMAAISEGSVQMETSSGTGEGDPYAELVGSQDIFSAIAVLLQMERGIR